ncbi:MAG TPA: TetR/AcrR family transcriptional regulator [Gammaproteobacteria bacterium]
MHANPARTTDRTTDSHSRKQREWQQREQLILDTAQQLLQQHGLQGLTMERVASEIEYSRGTVYNHFASKEEIVNGIGIRCMQKLTDMFRRAQQYTGSQRDRIAALGLAHSLYAQLHPMELQQLQLLKSPDIRSKISPQKQQSLLQMEQEITGIALDIVRSAITDGELPASQPAVPDSIVLGLWSMGYGANLLQLSGIPFAELGMQQPLDMMWLNTHKLLDSYQWQPLSEQFDIQQLKQTLCDALFTDEMLQLKQKQK